MPQHGGFCMVRQGIADRLPVVEGLRDTAMEIMGCTSLSFVFRIP